MRIFTALLTLWVVVALTGCGGSTPAPVKKKAPTPQWALNGITPNDTLTTMYGFGQGKNREDAIKIALNDMISRVGINVESSYNSYEKVENSYATSKITTNIKADISKTKVNNYKVAKSFRISYNEFAVVVASDKKKFVSGLKADVAARKASIQEQQKALKNEDTITKYNRKKALAKEAASLLSAVLMISELDKSYNKESDLAFIQRVKRDFIAQEQALKFAVSGDKSSREFVSKLKNYLAQKGFNVVNKQKNSLKIEIKTETNIVKGSIPIAVLKVQISIFDKHQRVGGNTIILKERYTNMQSVFKNAAIHFEQDIHEQGINEVAGINLDIDTND